MNEGSGKPGANHGEPEDDDADPGSRKTPSTDMQPEDAGTAESGNAGRGSAAENAMKQSRKTSNESGSER